jgi:hypothetical protein
VSLIAWPNNAPKDELESQLPENSFIPLEYPCTAIDFRDYFFYEHDSYHDQIQSELCPLSDPYRMQDARS